MRKNGSRLISIKQYRATDLFIFALILAAAEMFAFYGAKLLPNEAVYTFSLLVPIVLTVMMRWGWQSVIYAAGGGLLVCLLNFGNAQGIQYASYIIGNAFIALMLLPTYLIGKDRIKSKWWGSALFAAGGWLCVYLGRSVVWALYSLISPMQGVSVTAGFTAFIIGDILSLFMSVIVVLVLRRLDGMFEDQIIYLKRLDKERREKMRRDEFGDEPVEIDEEALSILNKHNDMF